MKYHLRIEVKLKPGHSDPEGETAADLLKELGYKAENVNVGKIYYVLLEATSRKNAETEAQEMCRRLFANPTKDDFIVAVEEKR